jgi:hypothetical protein
MAVQYGQAIWTFSMDMQHEHVARTRRMDTQHENVARTCSVDMDILSVVGIAIVLYVEMLKHLKKNQG